MSQFDNSMMDMSDNSMRSGSVGSSNKPLFDENEFERIEKDARLSLQVLANCVYITTCTVLHERRLLPPKSFTDFNVYGETKGYFMNESERNGKSVAKKFEQASVAIAKRTLNKFALVVESDDDPTTPIEAFVWSFQYDKTGESSARLGFKGKSQKFTVKYTDMHETSRQFCKLFSTLQDLLKDLAPLPVDAFPSFRLSLSEEPDHLQSYFQVDSFIDMKQFQIGKVRYPREEATLTYASKYIAPDDASTMEMSNLGNTEMGNQQYSTFDDPSPVFENTRQEENEASKTADGTMHQQNEEEEDSFMDFEEPLAIEAVKVPNPPPSPHADQDDSDLNDSGLSMQCEPNVESQAGVVAESLETTNFGIADKNVWDSVQESSETFDSSNMYSRLKPSPPKLVTPPPPPPPAVEHTLNESAQKKTTTTKRLPRKVAKVVVVSSEDEKRPEKTARKTARRSLAKKISTMTPGDEAEIITPSTAQPSNLEQMIEEDPKKVPKFGRVRSILELSEQKKAQSQPAPRRFGRVGSIRNLALSVAETATSAPKDIPKRKYGKSRSLFIRSH